MNERFRDLPAYAFPRLRALLDGVQPGAEPVDMSIGSPKHAPPGFVAQIMAADPMAYAGYPPNEGDPALRRAIGDWLARRYDVHFGPERIFPLNGTREGLFTAANGLVPDRKDGRTAAVLIPNPFYPIYAAGTASAGAEPVYLPATAATGHLPDLDAVPEETWARAGAIYMCSPANPQGAVASAGYWQALADKAARHGVRIFADECYSEIYQSAPPAGALQADIDPELVLAFHSLSKRSNLAGLRSGFCAGGPQTIATMLRMRSYGGAPLSVPAQRASAAAWADEAHVEENRRLYAAKFARARALDFDAPEAGFFLWVPVEDDEGTALRLWREAGVKVLPGSYLGREANGRNPGAGHIRIALVAPLEEVARGLTAIRERI